MNTGYVYQSAQVGEFRPAILYGTGPTAYALTGDPVSNPGANEYISFPSPCLTLSGNYEVQFFPLAAGIGSAFVRAGAPSPSQSGWVALWLNSGKQGVATVVQNAAGVGMTPGTTVPIVFSGAGGAAGTVTVLTATTISIKITNTGSYPGGAPTATVTGTGGTPPTLSVTAAAAAGQVASGTNLSAEQVQFGALVSQL